jgi:diadenosine tetraphosphate (Ap4A) HIT family hydrolase
MNDSNYPWFILVPARENIKEIFQLSETDQVQLLKEISFFSELLSKNYNADKINIAALGNLVPQLHIHVIVRYMDDPAWAGPVWGKVPIKIYTEPEIFRIVNKMKVLLKQDFDFYM